LSWNFQLFLFLIFSINYNKNYSLGQNPLKFNTRSHINCAYVWISQYHNFCLDTFLFTLLQNLQSEFHCIITLITIMTTFSIFIAKVWKLYTEAKKSKNYTITIIYYSYLKLKLIILTMDNDVNFFVLI